MPAGGSKWLWALALSFVVYLFPLIGPHAMFPLGGVIWRDLTRGEREPMWIAMDVVLAVLLQLAAFAGLYWLLKKPAVSRVVVLGLAVPVVAIAVEYSYLIYVPSHFLIDDDTAAEQGDWPVVCTAPEVSLIQIPHPDGPLNWSEVPVQASDGSSSLLRIPGCELMTLALPQAKVQPGGRVDFIVGLSYFVPGHGAIFSRQETASGAFTWNHIFNDRITTIPGLHATAVPILSVDGGWVAWLEKGSLAIEPLDRNEAPMQVVLPKLDLWEYMLRTLDMKREEIELVSSDNRVVIGLDGSLKTSESLPLAWDVYRDDGPYGVSWNFNGNSGTHHVLKGRNVNSAAMTPSGSLIAVSVATALNIGQIRDSLYVLRAKDGSEVFRRYLPNYTRTQVLFPTDDLMVYTGDREVVILRVPPGL
jgi:hypothetical protein